MVEFLDKQGLIKVNGNVIDINSLLAAKKFIREGKASGSSRQSVKLLSHEE